MKMNIPDYGDLITIFKVFTSKKMKKDNLFIKLIKK